MFKIPQSNKKIQVSSSSDNKGNIYRTKNIEIDDGKIKLAKRTMCVANSTDLTNLGASYPMSVAGVRDENGDVLIGATNKVYKSDLYGLTASKGFPIFEQDASTNTPTLDTTANNDSEHFDSKFLVSNDADVLSFGGSSWSTFSSNTYKLICAFENLNQLACASTSSIELLNTSAVIQNTLILQDHLNITSMAYSNHRLYIGTSSNGGTNGFIFEWDGLTAEANIGYQIESNAVTSVTPYKNGVIFTTEKGRNGYYTGGSEQELENFPAFVSENWNRVGASFPFNRINHRGIVQFKDKIYYAIDPRLSTANSNKDKLYMQDMPGGVWTYDKDVGLYHSYSIGQSQVTRTNDIPTTDVNTTTNVITIAGTTVPVTGTPVFYKTDDSIAEGTNSIGGLSVGKRYFTIKVSDTTLKLAETRTNALNGIAIDLTSTGVATQFLTFHPNYDFGAGLARATFLSKVDTCQSVSYVGNHLFYPSLMIAGSILKGSSNSSVNSVSVIQDEVENRGYIVTPKLESQDIKDTFESITIKHKPFVNEDDKIVVKYRIKDSHLKEYLEYGDTQLTGQYFTIATTNSFTTSKDLSDISVGDEVEIVQGAGAGYLAHVVSVINNSGTWTLTIDEDIQNFTAGDISYIIFSNWTKLGEITSAEFNQNYKEFELGIPSQWIQFKIELRGIGTTISEIMIDNKKLK